MNKPNGRPSKYRPDFPQRAIKYFQETYDAGEYPTIRGLSIVLGVNHDKLPEYEKIHDKFHAALEFGRSLGHTVLVRKALNEQFNPGFTKFLLVNNFGYSSEKTEAKVDANVAVSGININFVEPKKDGD
jgi:hypothetical protein